MKFWPFRRMGRPDADALFDELARAPGEKMSKRDRYQEYRALFLGSDQGRRVLRDIMDEAHSLGCPVPMNGQIDPLRAMVRIGEQNTVRNIINAMNAEPSPTPPQRPEKPKGWQP